MRQGEFLLSDCIYHGVWSCLVRKGENTCKDLFSKAAHRKGGIDCGQHLVEGPELPAKAPADLAKVD